MYHCRAHFYLTGRHLDVFDIIKQMPALEHFTHEWHESEEIEEAYAAGADVIFANLQNLDAAQMAERLLSCKGEETELILLAEKEQITRFEEMLSGITDIWVLPLSEKEVRFRFLKWQQGYKADRDFWETRQFFEATINHIPNLIWYKDKNGIHEKVNDSFCQVVNKTKEQVQGRGHAYIWDVEEDDPACIESEQEVMRTERTRISEETVKTGEGIRLLTTYKSPLYDLDGTVMGTVGVAIDVTREKDYEQEINKKNQVMEMMFTTMDCGVMCHTLDGRQILSVNRAALNILGYESKEELLAGGFDLVAGSVVEEDRTDLRRRIRTLKKEGDSTDVEYRVRHKDGKVIYVLGNVKLIKEKGELFYQRFLLDYSVQKLHEQKNERRQMELIQALSTDYNLVCYFDLDTGAGNSLRIEDEGGKLFGSFFSGEISYESSMKKYIETFVHEEDREMLEQAVSLAQLKKELTEKKTCYANYRAYTGEKIKYFRVKAVRSGEWGIRSDIVLGFRNVDEETRKEMEQKNLLEDALTQANRANKAKSAFLSNMSHDIRTPMNAIVGFTSLAIAHIDQKELVKEYLGKIRTSGNHLLSLINDVLDMSRIESGKMHVEESPCSLPDILHGLRSIVQADIRAKQLEFHIDTVDVLDEEICCDKLRLNQVLLNLLSNAIKYTQAGGTVSLRITEKGGAPEGKMNYEFRIKDNGIGMSEEFVARIFEPFERERTSTISGIQGTGLGMAITRNIVDMMNGTIEVKSQQGKGTEVAVSFTFRLGSEIKKPQTIEKLRNCRALVVDDDFNTCDSVSYMLGQIGLRAEWTMSGKEAVLRTRQAISREDHYSVYIIDWLLPDMNGIEVIRRIRKEAGGNVPMIVLTAYDWSDIEEEAREAGAVAFCSKPLFMSELSSCLRSVVNVEDDEQEEKAKEPERLRSGRLLLAEDNELNQEIAAAILEEAGFTVEIAGNGQIAVDLLKSSRPGYYQLVLMDIQMPVKDGYEAAREIRQFENKELASIPIIAMTANAFEEDRREALRSGMNGHITKPIDTVSLFDALDKMLD